MKSTRNQELDDRDIVELAALADGSLAPDRRAALEARVAASPELADLLAEQERAVGFAQSAAAEVEAPATLRARIPERRTAQRRHRPRQFVLAGAVRRRRGGRRRRVRDGVEQLHDELPCGPRTDDLAPGADGGATLTKTSSGWRIELDATGLPRLDAGRFYEAWLKNEAGTLVPVGTFNEGQDVTLWAGVSPIDFATLTVTREQADGDQASSGEKVLVGTVTTGD